MSPSGIFLLTFICVTFGLDFEWDNGVVKKYSEIKMLNGCFGDNFLRSWKESLIEASEKCYGEQISAQIPHFIKYLKNNAELINKFSDMKQQKPSSSNRLAQPQLKSSSKYVFMVPQATLTAIPPPSSHSQVPNDNQHIFTDLNHLLTSASQLPLKTANKFPEYQTVNNPNLHSPNFLPHFLPNFLPMEYYQHQHQPQPQQQQHPVTDFNFYQSPERIWWKRSVDGTKSSRRTRISKDMKQQSLAHLILSKVYPEIEILKQKMESSVSNITCVLKHMEIINKEGRPNYDYNTELLHILDLPASLRDNLLEAQDFCKEFSMCVPVERMSNPLVAELGSSFIFLRCMKKMIFHACMANDFIQSDFSSQFRFSKFSNRDSYSPQDTVRNLENLLESENDIGFGF